MDVNSYLRTEVFPSTFCPGCGHGIILNALIRAIDDLKLDMKKMVFVSGIGCAGWITSPHIKADTMHTTHGRPLAFATGIKLANPELKVVVIAGDGDLASIGGNHLIHAARRNIDITTICANNSIYGMTGGQASPTTPEGAVTLTTPEGSYYNPFDLCALVRGAGAGYAARATVYHARMLAKFIKNALSYDGFSFVDAVSTCPTQYGRRNSMSDPFEMLEWLKRNSTTREEKGKIVIKEWIARSAEK